MSLSKFLELNKFSFVLLTCKKKKQMWKRNIYRQKYPTNSYGNFLENLFEKNSLKIFKNKVVRKYLVDGMLFRKM